MAMLAEFADNCPPMEWHHLDYQVSDERGRLNLPIVTRLLQSTYWAGNRPAEAIARSLEESLCLGLYRGDAQVGFARWVTDRATFAYLCDVVIDPGHRGRGLGKWMVGCALEHPDVQGLTQVLRTEDAHEFYERFGFERAEYLRRRRSGDSNSPASPSPE